MTAVRAQNPDLAYVGKFERADLLTKIAMRIAAGEPTSEIFSAIIAGVEAAHPGVLCSILLLRDGCHIASAAAPSLPAFYSQAIDGVLVGPKAGSCGTAMYRGERVIVEDIANDPLWADYKDLAAQAGLASCWSEPIIGADGRPLGAFAMYQRRPARPDERDMGAIAAAAHLAAITLDRDAARGALAESEARARKAAAAERASMEEVEMFFDVSTDLLCISNLAGEIQRVNRAWTRMLGHAPEAVVGQDFRTLLHPDDIEPTRERVRGLGRTADDITITNRYRCADGSYRPIEWRARLSGERLFGIGRDVTEREAAQAAMKRAQEAAEAANRAKSDFLANMSHEVRTPLNGVIGILGALAHTELTPQQREMVDLIQASGATLERLVSDILDISKIEAGRLELEASDFDLEAALDSVLEVARIRCDDKGVAFRVERGPTARGRFIGDAVRIKQILDNLLSNAVKFTRAGEISVTVGVVEPAEMTGSAELMLSVSDTGIGFDPAMAESLFDRFSQADGAITRRFGGTGLGLSICKALTEMMDGRIEAQSVPGEGSRFSFRAPLPRAMSLEAYDRAQAEAADEAAPGPASARDAGPLRVLLAEDNPTNQKVVSLILGPVGAEVTVAENGAEALEAFRTGAFDLVLMDLQMPVMDGLAATRAIRALEAAEPGRPRTPIAVLSANAMAHHRDEALEAGADLHIAKPVTPRGLIEGVERALAAG